MVFPYHNKRIMSNKKTPLSLFVNKPVYLKLILALNTAYIPLKCRLNKLVKIKSIQDLNHVFKAEIILEAET